MLQTSIVATSSRRARLMSRVQKVPEQTAKEDKGNVFLNIDKHVNGNKFLAYYNR